MTAIFNGTFQFFPEAGYKLLRNGEMKTLLYLLVDGIYPNSLKFVKHMHQYLTEEEMKYSAKWESMQKDVERMFGVLH